MQGKGAGSDGWEPCGASLKRAGRGGSQAHATSLQPRPEPTNSAPGRRDRSHKELQQGEQAERAHMVSALAGS